MELLSGSLKRDMWMWASAGNKCTLDAYETTNTISPYGKNTTLTFKTRVKMMTLKHMKKRFSLHKIDSLIY